MNIAENIDCMDGMRRYPDKYFDLAVVDPPYGGGSSQTVHVEREREREAAGRIRTVQRTGQFPLRRVV